MREMKETQPPIVATIGSGRGVVGTLVLALLVCLAGFLQAGADEPAGPLPACRPIVLDANAWKWNWASWDQEKIVTFGHFQYTVFWSADRVFVLARRDLRENTVETLRLGQFTLSSDDGHRNTCLGVSRADGRLHLSWDHHNNPLRYTMSRAGFLTDPPPRLSPADIEPARPMLADRKLEARVTYPRFLTNPKGTLFLFYRIGGSGNGDNYLHRYDPADASWTRLGMVFSSRGTYAPWSESTSRCAYLHDLLFDAKGRLHATWVYREIGASWASNHDLHYATSDDSGITWQNNAGQPIAELANGDPIELSDPGIVVQEIPVYSWLMNAGCMALDSKCRPHVLTYKSRKIHRPKKLAHNPPEDLRRELVFMHYWRSDDGRWHRSEPIAPGPLGISRVDVVFDSDDTLHFFYPTEAGFQSFHAKADNGWQTWVGPRPLTGTKITGRDASKHDRRRWAEAGVLSFTAKIEPSAFAILDVEINP